MDVCKDTITTNLCNFLLSKGNLWGKNSRLFKHISPTYSILYVFQCACELKESIESNNEQVWMIVNRMNSLNEPNSSDETESS